MHPIVLNREYHPEREGWRQCEGGLLVELPVEREEVVFSGGMV
jgi:hypothetical protein